MDIFERTIRLGRLLEAVGGKIDSRKKLHKTIYLLQEAGVDFGQDYKYHNYGVFSPTLAYDLQFAQKVKIISEDPRDFGFRISVIEKNLRKIPYDWNPDEQVLKLAKELCRRKPQFLEAVSTIVYLSKNYYSGDDLMAKLRELKPDLNIDYDSAYSYAQEKFGVGCQQPMA